MNNIPQLHQRLTSDEIDLFELFHAIWKQKKWVIGCTILAGLLGVGYAFLAPRVYQVSSVLRPAAINELDALNRSEVYKLPPGDALAKVGAQLESYQARLGFFRANPALFEDLKRPGQSLEQSFEAFNSNAINLVMPDSKKSDAVNNAYLRLEMQYPEGIDGAAILNGFVDYAIAQERNQIGADLKVIVNNRLNELKGRIDAARDNYEKGKASKIARLLEADQVQRARLQDELTALRLQMKMERTNRLAELAEAISIARSVGIKNPTTPLSMGGDALNGSNQVMRTVVTNQKAPLYFMGTEVLEAERAALQQRTNDDFTNSRVAEIAKELRMLDTNREVEVLNSRKNEDMFLPDVEPLWAEEARLRSLNIDMSALKLVTVDRQAQASPNPIKPRVGIIIALSVVAGLMLGMLVVLIRHFVQVRRAIGPFSVFEDRQLPRQ
ncbi:Wzz/FepE/Etk N-terminal domain-containing protein [Pseudomonas marginalis]